MLRANFGTQLLLTPELQDYCVAENLTIMAYSPLLGGVYSRKDRVLPVQYISPINDIHVAKLNEVADELNVSPNAVVLAWMVQGSPPVIPMVTGSNIAQLEENLESLTIQLSDEQLERLNQEVVQPNKYS